MKKITLLLMILMAFTSYSQVAIGSSDDGDAFNSSPINPYYGFSYSQTIYLASEINASGDITSLNYQLDAGTDISSCDETVDVWIGHTTNASFASTSDWADVSTLTQVLTSGTITAAGDVVTITFSTPFTYNGTDNLLIAVDANEAGFGAFADVFLQTTGPADTSLHHRSDSVNADPVTGTPTGALASVRGNVTMNGITAVCLPAAATASIVEDCGNSQFSILVDVTDLGDSVNLEITNDAAVASTTVTAIGGVTVGPFPIGTPVVLTLENENDDICDVALDSILDFCPTAANTLDYYNLQWPATLAFPENEMTDQFVYAQAYEAGLTDTTMGSAAAGIEAWIGYSSTDTDPSGTGWTWEVATFNAEVGNNDEYAVDMQDLGLAEGTYYYASRFTLNAGPFMYGGILADGSNGGVWDGTTNISGVLTVQPRVPVPGDDCANPIVVSSLPYNTTDDTVNYTNEFSNGDSACSSFYMSGNDVVYTYTPSADASINFGLSGLSATYSGIHILDGCPTDAMTTCLGFEGNSGSADRAVEDISVVNGTTYYIVISTWAAPNSVAYTLDITENTCTNATVAYAVVNDCDNSGGFNIEVDITDMGSATDITVTDDQGSAAQTTMTATTLTFGPYVNATDVVITVSNDNDVSCVQTSGTLTQASCPPANDECAGAESLVIGNTVPGTTAGATGASATSCNGSIGNDVWYTVVGDGGDITITVDAASEDQQIGIFESVDCAGITLGSCDYSEDGFSNPDPITFPTTNGTNYYVQVGAWLQSGSPSTFTINVSSSILSTTEFENEAAFSYYPNPVKNTLTLNAQNTIENVTMYNMLGQEVLRATPNAIDSDIDMSNLQTGTYFVKVTIANITKTVRVIKQ